MKKKKKKFNKIYKYCNNHILYFNCYYKNQITNMFLTQKLINIIKISTIKYIKLQKKKSMTKKNADVN